MREGLRRRILLTVLAVLLLSAARRYLPLTSGPDGAEPARESAQSSGVAVGPLHPNTQVATLDLARLDGARPSMAAGRDPWRFQDPTPHKAHPETASAAATREPTPVPPPLPTAASPELTLEYLGSFGPRDRKIAVLRDGGRTFNALEGDVIDGRFIVERIGYESVEVRLVSFPGGPAKRLGL